MSRERLEAFGLGDEDWEAWLASGGDFESWLLDRVARRPSGSRARDVYGADDVHDFARRAILDALRLGSGDSLLDVGCGGGMLLRDALAAGAEATGLDHSAEMVALARERVGGRGVRVVQGDAERLPFGDGTFTAVSMSIVFFFLPDPIAALREARRVLGAGGRLAVYTTAPELRGTPAAPEPVASHGRFYDDGTLAGFGRDTGFADVAVVSEDGGQLLTGIASSPR